ncbi:MAG: Caa(3)-type oxidase subunit IV [Rhodospirillales bacterium]|nr:Caa(3)-type oxidase subunit IV [Acetobacter sp.]
MAAQTSPQRRTLFLIYLSLVVLLVLTAIGAKLPFSAGTHDLLAYGISVAKTVLIALIFMEMRYNKGVVRVFAGAGLVWLFLLFLLTFNDYLTRNWRF